jgi:phage replication-related protein YjqB (UPF0714/DUF867 family)
MVNIIAKAIAGKDFNYYCFNGEKFRNNCDLHITNDLFDDKKALALVTISRLTYNDIQKQNLLIPQNKAQTLNPLIKV